MSPEQPASGRFRPPENLLPAHAQRGARTEGGDREIFLTWGGAVYGPARAEEVTAGVRTSWFEKGTLFWVEGQTEWLPVEEFPGLHKEGHHTLAGRRIGAAPDEAPPVPVRPVRASRPASRSSGARSRHAGRRSGRSGSSRKTGRRRPGKRGRLYVFGGILLAVSLTLVMLFLLMLA